ncbi:hypothetical protein HanIR_Chr04g0168461 [Helianthus annuus]|nr:hypothetical protein HanIR_Chr04g0168461 [Helianthus annuus]
MVISLYLNIDRFISATQFISKPLHQTHHHHHRSTIHLRHHQIRPLLHTHPFPHTYFAKNPAFQQRPSSSPVLPPSPNGGFDMSNCFRRERERERPGGTAPPPETFPTEAVIISGLTAITKRRIRHVKLFSERKRERQRYQVVRHHHRKHRHHLQSHHHR